MKTKTMELNLNTYKLHEVDVPLNCPYCHIPTHYKAISAVSADGGGSVTLVIQVLQADCCGKHLFTIYKKESSKTEYQLIYTYPEPLITSISESIQKISPRFIKLYSDSEFAYRRNMFELAGSGFRNSLEVLIKDYAVNELHENIDTVSKMNLFNAIDHYLPDERLKNAADVVRIIGNDYTHYQRKYEQHDVQILKYYLDVFIQRINTNYLLDHPPLSRD